MKPLVAAAFAVLLCAVATQTMAHSDSRRASGPRLEESRQGENTSGRELVAKEILQKVGSHHILRAPDLDKVPSAHKAVIAGCAEIVSLTFKGELTLQALENETMLRKKEEALARLIKMHAGARALTADLSGGSEPSEVLLAKEERALVGRRFGQLMALAVPGEPDASKARAVYMATASEASDFRVFACPPPGGRGL